jgi:hypothetical protein
MKNIIPEAEVVETVEQVANPISFSPVTINEEDSCCRATRRNYRNNLM